ncbi:thiosulfate sulfurtransferase 18-like [Primulina huaijiensis]|uniref:thiosulfate sulfurtransferase 18-like n=1 Tax=Primulina huaijiensis TaxID=1492673 RepID=UPI003CC74B25
MDMKKSSNAEIITVDVHAARNLLNSGYLYLDVRTEEEFQSGHVENAFNVPYMFSTPNGRVKNPNFVDQVLSTHDREDLLLVGCQSGVRSVYATTDLLDAGFKHAYNMGGGYIEWVKSSFEAKKPTTLNPPSIPEEHPIKKLNMNPPPMVPNEPIGQSSLTVKI